MLNAQRTSRLQAQKTNFKQLNRQLNTLQSTHKLTMQGHNPTEHAAEILRLDTEKFRIAKEASQLETEGERLESEIERTRAMVEECEAQGPEGGDAARRVEGMDDEILYVALSILYDLDANMIASRLKLKVYRMLNIDVEPDKQTGLYTKAVVRNAQKGDVHVVNIDPKFSRYFYANYFWNTL
jgi:kinetochore protein Spc24, fungi type